MPISGGLLDLLRRPLTLAWVPLSALASSAVVALLLFVYLAINELPRSLLHRSAILAAVGPSFAALIGLLVGQTVKELQHCQFAWGLPRLRQRLLPAALGIGFIVAGFGREIIVVLAAAAAVVIVPFSGELPDPIGVWQSFPSFSFGLFALSLLAYWVGVHPSAINLPLVLVPVVALSPWVVVISEGWGVVAAALSVPLTAFLVYDAFSVAAARRRPFVVTRPLSGASRARGRPPSSPLARVVGGQAWSKGGPGDSSIRWIRAGWYENHGWLARGSLQLVVLTALVAVFLLASMVITTMLSAPSLWLSEGYRSVPNFVRASIDTIIVGSMIVGVPLLVAYLCYGSISLRPDGGYPLSRRQRARIEYESSLAETAVVCALLAGTLLGLFKVLMLLFPGLGMPWPTHMGGEQGWVVALGRAVAALFVIAPIVQFFRLRYLRSPSPRSPVVRLLLILLLTAVLAWIGTLTVLASLYMPARYPLAFHVVMFATATVIAQYLYRRALDRYFRTADLV